MSNEQFTATVERLKRILNRCGWTPHLWHKTGNCWYARAAKKGPDGEWHGKYIAPLHAIDGLETGKIIAMLPPVA